MGRSLIGKIAGGLRPGPWPVGTGAAFAHPGVARVLLLGVLLDTHRQGNHAGGSRMFLVWRGALTRAYGEVVQRPA